MKFVKFAFFFISSGINMNACFIFFPSDKLSQSNPCRDPSAIEYNECALRLKNVIFFREERFVSFI